MENKTYTFKAEDIFEDIPDDPEHINMKIPEEIQELMGIVPGDTVRVLWGDKGTIVMEKVEEKETDVQE